ncbi:MAG: M56 family metallopeptidase [Bacteroidetes bacterium]|nr:M56 family metallopeptidase [Bacteroidota bacterium]
MNTLLLYLFESTLCLSVLFAIYWFFLRRETFFQLNRFYLLAMALFSVIFPLLPFRWTPSDPSSSVAVLLEPVMITPAKVEQELQANLHWIEIAAAIYFTGVIIFLLRFVLQLIQIQKITRRFGIRKLHGRRVVFVDRGYSPFSFFNLVYINEAAVPPDSLPTILKHEQVHIRQHHTVDMILIELATLMQWFNPVAWMVGREVKTIHEYLADEGVLQNGISRHKYQQMILDETMGLQVNYLTNNFNVSLLKKRIAMMTKSKSKTWAKSKALIALPVVLLLFFFLTASSFSNSETMNTGTPEFTPIHLLSIPGPVIQDKQKKEKQVKYVSPVTGNEVYTVVEKLPSFPGGEEGYRKFLIENIKYPETAIKNAVTGTVYITFVVEKDGSVREVKVLRGIGSGCDEEALRVVKMMPNWNPGEQKGKPVAVQYNLPIKFNLDKHKKEEPKK